mmetsp:Transcript_13804/g.20586  ORF Transcript_13804/g.20586 Transcript_13804/m.20586 type:complete len:100 (-) Transcript_13804:35-334(-)
MPSVVLNPCMLPSPLTIFIASSLKPTKAVDGAPIHRWHKVQWQFARKMGTPVASKAQAPQKQLPRKGSIATSASAEVDVMETEFELQQSNRTKKGAMTQ